MKIVVLILYFIVSCTTNDVTEDIHSFDTAMLFMNYRKSTDQSLCLSSLNPITYDLFQIKNVLSQVMEKPVDDPMVDKAAREFIHEYSRTSSDGDAVDKFIFEHFLDESCQTSIINKDDPIEQVIKEFSLKQSDMSKLRSAQILAFSCAVEILYNGQLRYADSDTYGKERKIVEMSYVVYRIENHISGIPYDGISFNLIYITESIIVKTSNTNNLPEEHIYKCHLRNAETSYKLNKLEYVEGAFKMLIDELYENETCYLSKLSTERQSYLKNILADTVHGKLDEVEQKALIVSFEKLFYDYEYLNIFGKTELYRYLQNFLEFPECTFDYKSFSSGFSEQIQNIRNYKFQNTKLVDIGEIVAVFCPLLEIKNTPQRTFDDEYEIEIRKISDIYTFFLNYSQTDIERSFTKFLYKHMNAVSGDSKKIRRSFYDSYYYKLEYACILDYGMFFFKDRFQPVLSAFESFMNDSYAPLFCPDRTWKESSFTNGIRDLLLGSNDYDLTSFGYVYDRIAEILEQSTQYLDVPFDEFIDLDGQLCSLKKDIDYHTIKFDKDHSPAYDLDSLKESLISRCSSINSLARALSDFQLSLSLQNKSLICSAYINLSRINTQFNLLIAEERFTILKSYIDGITEVSEQGSGIKAHLECEIHRVTINGAFYESSLFISIYSLVVVSFFDNQTCTYKSDTFDDRNLLDLAGLLMKHPDFQDSEFDTVVTYIIPNLKMIFQEYDALLLRYKLSSEFTNRLVNTKTCILDEFDDFKLSKEIYDFIFETYTDNFPCRSTFVVNIFTCHALKHIKSAKDKLENKNKLTSSDMAALDELVSQVLVKYPQLKERTPTNFKYLLMNVTLTDEFYNLIDTVLKVSIAKCYLRKSYFKDDPSSGGSSNNNGTSNNSGTNNNNGPKNNNAKTDNTVTHGSSNSNKPDDIYYVNSGDNKLCSKSIAAIVIITLFLVVVLVSTVIYFIRQKRRYH